MLVETDRGGEGRERESSGPIGSDILVAGDLFIALVMPPPAKGIGWVMGASSKVKIDGECHVSMR